MKKKLAIIFACIMLCATVALTGCGNSSYSKIKVAGKQDYDYTVYSNGGNSVQYGNYIYFINGARGYEDTDGAQNTWGKVTKGALYRAELNGEKQSGVVEGVNVDGEFKIKADSKGVEFITTEGLDYNEKTINIVNVQLIAPKVIGTSGYSDGGIFIYDDYIYYATPNNEKDKTGKVQTSRTDFFRSKLDGTNTQKIYTTESDSATSPYVFHKKGNSVYLVTYYGTQVVSVECSAKKIEQPAQIAKDIKGALLPYRTTYKKGDISVTPDDFVYILRDAIEGEDSQKTGTVVEVMECDGVSGGKILSLGKTVTSLEAVRDGIFFYRSPDQSSNDSIFYNNLHDALLDAKYGIPSYANYQNNLADTEPNKVGSNISGKLLSSNKIADFTKTYCFRAGGIKSNVCYAIGIKASGAYLLSNMLETKYIYNGALTFSFVDGEYLYFTKGESKTLYRTEWNKAVSEKTDETKEIKISDGDITDNGLKPDITAGYLVYMSDVDEWAKGYMMFKKINGIEGAKQQFVGEKITADLKPKEEKEEDKKEEKKGCGSVVSSSVDGSFVLAMSILCGGGMFAVAILKKKKSR